MRLYWIPNLFKSFQSKELKKERIPTQKSNKPATSKQRASNKQATNKQQTSDWWYFPSSSSNPLQLKNDALNMTTIRSDFEAKKSSDPKFYYQCLLTKIASYKKFALLPKIASLTSLSQTVFKDNLSLTWRQRRRLWHKLTHDLSRARFSTLQSSPISYSFS